MSLLYVFWHGPRPDVEPARYEAALARFLSDLSRGAREAALSLTALSARVDGLPWIDTAGPVWQDTYRVDDMAGLERLEGLAVGATAGASHQAAASMAGPGAAGLYRSLGSDTPVGADWSCWLDKPASTARAAFEAELLADAGRLGASVWRRVMTLSAAPEFLVRVPGTPAWPARWTTTAQIAAERPVLHGPA